MKRRILALFLLLLTMASGAIGNNMNSRGTIFYTGPTPLSTSLLKWMAETFDHFICGHDTGSNADSIKKYNPNAKLYMYNSASDNYLDIPLHASAEDTMVAHIAALHGWDKELGYLHYYKNSVITLGFNPPITYTIPGWDGVAGASGPEGANATADSLYEARIPVYFWGANDKRALVNFDGANARQLAKEVMLAISADNKFDSPSNVYPDGIFLDNAAYRIFNTGTQVSGGEVWEHPTHIKLSGSAGAFTNWRWPGFRQFLVDLRDTLATMGMTTMQNMANVWTNDYYIYKTADVLFEEFEYNPIRDVDVNASHIFARATACRDSGMLQYFSCSPQKSYSPCSVTYGQMILSNLSLFMAAASDSSIFAQMNWPYPGLVGWDTLHTRGCIQSARSNLGEPTSDTYLLASGTADGYGYPWKVYARDYENGLAIARNRGAFDQQICELGAVTVNLPNIGPGDDWYPVDQDGETDSTPVSTWSIRNGTGYLFYTHAVWPDPPNTLFSADTLSFGAPYTVQFADESEGFPESWHWSFGDGDTSILQHPTHRYTTLDTFDVTLIATNQAGSDTLTKADYLMSRIIYAWPSILAQYEGDYSGYQYDVPVLLSEPCQESVSIKFSVYDSSAVADSDYVNLMTDSLLTYSPGMTEAYVSLAILGDTLVENTEMIMISFSEAVGCTLFYTLPQWVDILDDDSPGDIKGSRWYTIGR